MKTLRDALRPFAQVADAYHDNRLDEVRPDWGNPIEEDAQAEIVTGRGGQQLLTLQDFLNARAALSATSYDPIIAYLQRAETLIREKHYEAAAAQIRRALEVMKT